MSHVEGVDTQGGKVSTILVLSAYNHCWDTCPMIPSLLCTQQHQRLQFRDHSPRSLLGEKVGRREALWLLQAMEWQQLSLHCGWGRGIFRLSMSTKNLCICFCSTPASSSGYQNISKQMHRQLSVLFLSHIYNCYLQIFYSQYFLTAFPH